MTDSGSPDAFEPSWWLPGPHLPTVWANVLGRRPALQLRSQRLELPDGDFVDLAWYGPTDGPFVLILHGLEGSSRSPYALRLMHAFDARGWGSVVMHFRGCSGVPNRLPKSYHSGATEDPAYVIRWITDRYPGKPIAAVGFSLGGNVLLKLLGEGHPELDIRAAVAVSVPFELAACAHRVNRGLSRVYQRRFLNSLRRRMRTKFQAANAQVPIDRLDEFRDFFAFDHHITAPLHGFASANDYYARCSSRQFLRHITKPTLIVHAQNDPMLDPNSIPTLGDLPGSVEMEVHAKGGHVGFVEGTIPGFGRYYLERRIPAYLDKHLRL